MPLRKRKLRVDLTPAIRHLSIITKGLASTKMIGEHKSIFKGKGLDFAGYRTYEASDDASLIDWKSTVRANDILIKEFEEERNIDVFFLVDASNKMIFGSTEHLKNEYAAQLVASLAYVTLQAGDAIGLAMFTEKIVLSYLPNRSREQFYTISRSLVNANHYGGDYDLGQALKFAVDNLKLGSIVIVVSDFIGLKGNWQRPLKVASKKFDLIGIMITDPRDKELPDDNSTIVIGDPFSDRQATIVPSLIKNRYAAYAKKQKEKVRKAFEESGSSFVELGTDKPFEAAIVSFFRKRAQYIRRT